MNFSQFLIERRTQKNIHSSKDHFESLGGEKMLGISLRHFQQIESGKYPPSEKLLVSVFNKTSPSSYRALFLAYFHSTQKENKNAKALSEYLEHHLSPAVDTVAKSVWEEGRPLMYYSEEQLEFFIQNPDALKFHKRLMLFDKVSARKTGIYPSKLKILEQLELITIKDDTIYPSRTLYRIPTYENSGPRQTSKGADYIKKHLEVYLSKEGAPNQVLAQAMQLVSPSVAKRILEQMESFKKWVQSTASDETDETKVPLIFIGFAKALDRKEL
ncbi:MAG: hypothetical protein KA116_01690 [Proteobacteria bacterium]|nr:hypothetical protein [Pseudomonadota bacterium]